MLKGKISSISHCGTYLASYSKGKNLLEVYKLHTSNLHRSYPIHELINTQLIANGIGNASSTRLVVGEIKWEEILEGSESSKLGIVIESHALLMIFDIRQINTSPIIIQQSRSEGIESFSWISPIKQSEESPGAYINSKQVLIFGKFHLLAKLYSLDCTSVLITILKPTKSEILVRPNRDNSMWSIFANSLDYTSSVILYHFYNEGSTSTLMYNFKLTTNPMTDFDINWSKSGKWLCYFSKLDNVFGFKLKVFNSLGIHQSQIIHAMAVPTGLPILDINWKTKGIEDKKSSDSLIVVGSTNYIHQWLKVDQDEYILVSSINDLREMEMILVSMRSLSIVGKSTIKTFKPLVSWRETKDAHSAKYRKVSNASIQPRCAVENVGELDSYVFFNFGDMLMIYNVIIALGEVKFELEACISFISNIKSAAFTMNSPVKLLIVTEDHIALYNTKSKLVEVLFSSRKSIDSSHLLLTEKNHVVILNATESAEETHIENWMTIIDLQPSMPAEEDRNLIKTKKYNYRVDKPEDLDPNHDSNIVDLTRLKRNRFDNHRLSLLNANLEEITDTFDHKKRIRK